MLTPKVRELLEQAVERAPSVDIQDPPSPAFGSGNLGEVRRHRLEVDFVVRDWPDIRDKLHPTLQQLGQYADSQLLDSKTILQFLLEGATARGPDQVYFRLLSELDDTELRGRLEADERSETPTSHKVTEEALWVLNLGLWESQFLPSQNGFLEPHGLWAGVMFSDSVAGRLLCDFYPIGMRVVGWAAIHTDQQRKQVQALLKERPNSRGLRRLLHDDRAEHALWFLKHLPEEAHIYLVSPHKETYAEAARLFREHLEAGASVNFLYHAALYFSRIEPELTMELCGLGKTLEPNGARWQEHLAFLFRRQGDAEREMTELLEAIEISPEQSKASRLAAATRRAFELKQWALAKELCDRFLALSRRFHYERGHPTHAWGTIHNILGQLALSDNNLDQVEHCLRQLWKSDFRDPGELGERMVQSGQQTLVLEILDEFLNSDDISDYEHERMSEWRDELVERED